MGRPDSETPIEVARLPSGDPFVFEDIEGEGPPAYEESLLGDKPQEEEADGIAEAVGELRIQDEKREARLEARRSRQLTTEQVAPPSYNASVAGPMISSSQQPSPSPDSTYPGSISFPQPRLPMGPSAKTPEKPQLTPLGHTGFVREDFGRQFVPHSNESITCALPLMAGTLILFGTTSGLKVLSTFREAAVRNIWTGLAVWDIRVLRITEEEGKTPKGSVLVLCGGVEDPNSPGKPKVKGGEVEARVWKLGSLASLGRWSATLGDQWEGLDLTPPKKGKGKGKEKSTTPIVSGSRLRGDGSSTRPISQEELDLAKEWTAAHVSLPTSTSTKPADIISVATRTDEPEIFVAIATPSHVLLHIGQSSSSGFSFRMCKVFYLPFAPSRIGLLELGRNVIAPPNRGESRGLSMDDKNQDLPRREPGVLGVYVSFGNRACVIRTDNSAVVDFKPPSGRGDMKGGGEWGEMQAFMVGGTEMYLFTRGSETLVYPAPLRLPIATPPIVSTSWPEVPRSVLALPDPSGRAEFTLLSANPSGEFATQRAAAAGGGPFLLFQQQAVLFGPCRLLPMSWETEGDVYMSAGGKDKDWKLVRLENTA